MGSRRGLPLGLMSWPSQFEDCWSLRLQSQIFQRKSLRLMPFGVSYGWSPSVTFHGARVSQSSAVVLQLLLPVQVATWRLRRPSLFATSWRLFLATSLQGLEGAAGFAGPRCL